MGPTRAFLIIAGGRLVHERYDRETTPGTTLASWSMAKTITALVAGMLAGDGRLDLDQPLAAPEWPAADPRLAITFRQALHMSDGLKFLEDYADGEKSDTIEMLFGSGKNDMAAYAAARPLAHGPGQFWNYSSGTTNLIARALGTIIGNGRAEFEDFLMRRLFRPLGMTGAIPKFDAAGTFIGSSYCFAPARDFARLGLFCLRGGIWAGQPLLPPGYIDFLRTPAPACPDGTYGAHVWLGHPGPPGAFSMNGFAGQYVMMVPQADLIMIRLGTSREDQQPAVRDHLTAMAKAWITAA